MYSIVWKYTIKPEHRNKFESEYGSRGAWSQLFKRSEDYLGSDLYRNLSIPNEYLLTDHWSSQKTYEQFLHAQEQLYRDLSDRFEHLYAKEERLCTYQSQD